MFSPSIAILTSLRRVLAHAAFPACSSFPARAGAALAAVLVALLPVRAVTPGGDLEPVRNLGAAVVNRDRHDGGLPLVVGAHSYQLFRANRTDLNEGNGKGWTYNHAPNMAHWNNRFYVEFVTLPVNENEYPANGAANRLLTWSGDGKTWAKPIQAFPHVPVGALTGLSGALSVQVSRGCFYVASNGRLLATTSLGTNSNKAVGRLVREIYNTDPPTFGPTYFIRYYVHSGFSAANTGSTGLASYTAAADSGFKAACAELLTRSLITENWWEDELNAQNTDATTRPSDGFYKVPYVQGEVDDNFTKAMWTFQRADGNWVAGWKYGAFAVWNSAASTWTPPRLGRSIVTSAAKTWGQRTPDNRYALIYNPSSDNYRRWPLAMVTSADGISFDHLGTICGEVPPMRFKGISKESGQQYTRGIESWNGQPETSGFWVAHSINKEDLWVTRVPASSATRVTAPVNDNFEAAVEAGVVIPSWNIYSPRWAPVDVATFEGSKRLRLQDRDPYDYAKAARVFPEAGVVTVSFQVRPAQNNGQLDVELLTPEGLRPVRLSFGADGNFKANQGGAMQNLGAYASGVWMTVTITANCAAGTYSVTAGGLSGTGRAFAEAAVSLARLELRTGDFRTSPVSTTAPYTTADLSGADTPAANRIFHIDNVATAADTTGPRVLEAFGDGKDRITVNFDEPLGTSAATAANYVLSPALSVDKAVLQAGGKSVVLTLGGDLTAGTTYTVTVANVRDPANNLLQAGPAPTFTVPTAPPTANLRLWVRGDAGVTADGSGFVSSWADQSAAGNTLTNSVSGTGSKPRRIDGVLNGRPVLRFDGGDHLSRAVSGLIAEKAGIFLVFKAGRPASGQFVFDTATDGQLSRHQFVQNANWLELKVDANGGAINNDAAPADSFVLAAYVMAGSASFSRLNAANHRVGAFSDYGASGLYSQIPTATGSPFVLGARYTRDQGFYNGDLAEVLIYNQAPSAAQLRQVEAYLRNKYFAQPGQAAAPGFSPAAGSYTAAQSVTLSSTTSGASIRYTTNGTDPTATTGTLYTAPINVSATTTLKAIACKSGLSDSTVATASYTIDSGGGGSVLWESNFNGDATGAAPANWTLSAATNTTATVQEFPAAGDKSVRLTDNNAAGLASLSRTFADQSGTVIWAFRFQQAGNGLATQLGSAASDAVEFQTAGGQLQALSGGVWTNLMPVSNNVWYALKVELDPVTDTYDLYSEEAGVWVLKAADAPFKTAQTVLNRVRMFTSYPGSGVTAYVDDVRVSLPGAANQPPTANSDSATTNEGTAVTVNVLANDSDADSGPGALVLQSVGPAAHGSTQIVSGQARYLPNAGFYGSDSFSYTISDGAATASATVAVTVASTALANNLSGTSPALSGADIGSGGSGSSRVLVDGRWEINGAGSGLAGAADAFHFESRGQSGDFEVFARVQSLVSNGAAPLAGVMIREGLAAGARTVALAATPASSYRQAARTSTGGSGTLTTPTPTYTFPHGWVGLVRAGGLITVHASTDGANWNQVGSVTLAALSPSAQVGVFATSGTAGVTARAVVSDFEINATASGELALDRTGWTASASRSYTGLPPAQALDGTLATRWASGAPMSNGMWFQLDLGTPQTFDALVLDAGSSSGDYPRGYALALSADGTTFGAAIATGAGTGALTDIALPVAVTTRYLRITQTGSHPTNWWSIHELDLFRSALDRRAWTAASPDSYPGSAPALALDSDRTTRWSSDGVQTSGFSFTLDLGAAQYFDTLVLESRVSPNDFPRGFAVSTSNDGTSFTSVATGSGTSFVVESALGTQLARYVRIALMQGHPTYWWSIDEVNLHHSAYSRVGWNAVASTSHGNHPAALALDGESTTRWATGSPQVNGQTFTVDLGTARTFSRLVLDATQASLDYPRGYAIHVSNDGTTWGNAVATGAGSVVTTATFPAQTACHLRITQTGSTASAWWSINELYLYP